MLFTTIVRLHRTGVMGIKKGSQHCGVHGLQGKDPDFHVCVRVWVRVCATYYRSKIVQYVLSKYQFFPQGVKFNRDLSR